MPTPRNGRTFINDAGRCRVSTGHELCHVWNLDKVADVGGVPVRKKLTSRLKHERVEGGVSDQTDLNKN